MSVIYDYLGNKLEYKILEKNGILYIKKIHINPKSHHQGYKLIENLLRIYDDEFTIIVSIDDKIDLDHEEINFIINLFKKFNFKIVNSANEVNGTDNFVIVYNNNLYDQLSKDNNKIIDIDFKDLSSDEEDGFGEDRNVKN